jgi:hypothetical protein
MSLRLACLAVLRAFGWLALIARSDCAKDADSAWRRRPGGRVHRRPGPAETPDTLIRRVMGALVVAIGIRYLWSGPG